MKLRQAAVRELARQEQDRQRAQQDPCYLISHMTAVDQRDGTRFTLQHLRDPLEPGEVWLEGNTLRTRDKSWRWQRWVADKVLADERLIVLKGRQIGVTWVVLAVDVAEAVLRPDTASLLYRQREDEAIDNVRRWWVLYQSLPAHFKAGIEVITPSRGDRPGASGVVLRHADGRLSEVFPMTSAAASGHGRTVRRVILDEGAHIEKLAQIRAAVEPAAGRAHINNVSTANGRSNPETGDGNEFHRLWAVPDSGYHRVFLPYDIHPDRDADWYDNAPEVQSLPLHLRQQNFPKDEHEAFALSDRLFFDPDTLADYREKVRHPEYRFDFVDPDLWRDGKRGEEALAKRGNAKVQKHDDGFVRVYEPPRPDTKYAIGADVATGRGADYSVAYVVDLATMELACEFIGKLDADLFAAQLHYLGRWYGTRSGCQQDAVIAPEVAGGHGEAVIIALRDGREGRPAYPKLYRHILSSRPDLPVSKPYGFPTNIKTRPLILNQLEKALRERALPYVSNDLLYQMEEFVHHDHGTSPRARDGCHDDCVMASAITLEMYRLYGHHEHRPRPKPARRKPPAAQLIGRKAAGRRRPLPAQPDRDTA